MRGVWTCVLLLMGGMAGGCQGSDTPADDTVATSQLGSEEEDLLARRDALLKSRQQLARERDDLADRRRSMLAEGGNPAELDQKASALASQERELDHEESALNDKLDRVLAQRRAMMEALSAASGGEAKVVARESAIAARERVLAAREERIATREEAMAGRERTLAIRERDTCAAGPTTIIQQAPAKGTTYRKRDVEPLLANARQTMSRKGILASDLPAPAQGLEKEATAAMAEGDFGRARFAATQLLATVRTAAIDKAFVAQKISRLSAAVKGRTLPSALQSEVDELFRQATASYGDGDFSRANARINRIYALLQ